MDNIVTWVAISISIIFSVIVAILVQLFIVPWQYRKITKNCAVKFSINDSNDSTPLESPKQNRRSTSIVQLDQKTLPSITEQTELASFNNFGELNPCFYTNGKIANDNELKNKYKIDAKIVEKAENLLRNNRSLDNMDLTITSLNFIDDYQHQNICLHSTANRETLQTFFEPNKQR